MEIKGHDLERTWLCSVLFTDIVNYTAQPVQQQIEWKMRFNHFLTTALADVDPDERYVLDTGDGAAVCFMGAPEPAMQAALSLREAFIQDQRAHVEGFCIRIGLNLGPLRLMKDVNGRVNAVGEAINVAQRVMSFARLNEILVSRSFYETVSCLSETNARMFSPLGIRKDKHEREHVVYHLDPDGFDNVQPATEKAGNSAALVESLFEEETLRKISRFLSPIIGPIANRLIRDESTRAQDLPELAQRLSAHLPDGRSREGFLQKWKAEFGHVPASENRPVVKEGARKRGTGPEDAAFTERATKELARYIGPMAKIIVANAAKTCGSTAELLETISQEIPDAKDRDAFRKAVTGIH
jgi:class 3 adenylate cyclase